MGNFFVNCSENALYSLAISLRNENPEDKYDTMRSYVLRNRTYEVDLAVKHGILRIPKINIE